jgi:hypothetical protein
METCKSVRPIRKALVDVRHWMPGIKEETGTAVTYRKEIVRKATTLQRTIWLLKFSRQ